MLESITANGHSFDECKDVLRKSTSQSFLGASRNFEFNADIKLATGFKEFNTWCRENDIPVVIVSRCLVKFCSSS